MIELNTLKNNLQEQLQAISNQLQYKYNFNIATDTGERKKPIREGNEVTCFTNGVLSLVSSDISNLTDGTLFATQTCSLSIEVSLPDTIEDVYYNGEFVAPGKETVIKQTRQILETLAQNNTYSEMQSEAGENYIVSTVYRFAQSGIREILPGEGDAFTYTMYIYYSFVENGVNTRNVTFTLDGIVFPYQANTQNRSLTYDNNVYANTTDGAVCNMPVQSNWSATFELPAVKGGVFETMLDFILNAPLNRIHALELTINGVRRLFFVTIGEGTMNGETIKNVGLKVTFFNAVPNYYLVGLPDTIKVYETSEAGSTYKVIDLGASGGWWLFVDKTTGVMNTQSATYMKPLDDKAIDINADNLLLITTAPLGEYAVGWVEV